MVQPIRRVMVRWQCPHCHLTRSKRQAITEHMTRCWRNPAARACLTCDHREDPSGDGINEPFSPEGCRLNIALPERGLNVHCVSWQAGEG